MVSYYNPSMMYRHQQSVTSPNSGQFSNTSMHHPWYAAASGYHQTAAAGTQMQQLQTAAAAAASYCMQDEQQMWHPHTHHTVFHNSDFSEFGGMVSGGTSGGPPILQHTIDPDNHHQLPSPSITVSGSEMSSPGARSGNISPQNSQNSNRPPPARSPYEWMKKTSYQAQPNPGKTRTKDKYRVVYTDHQRVELEKEFYYSRYITIRRKAELANNLGLSERQVKIWFQNRRAKERKQVKKREELNHKDTTLISMTQMAQQRIIQNNNNNNNGNAANAQIMGQTDNITRLV